MSEVKAKEILIPAEFARLFDTDWREAAIYGGRGSLKSHTVARVLLIRAMQKPGRCGCFREFQNSIADSSHSLLSNLIEEYELPNFKVTNDSIVNTTTGYDFIFKGLRNNVQSIKSIEGMTEAWVEEAQTITEKSIDVLTPTVRLHPVCTQITLETTKSQSRRKANTITAKRYQERPTSKTRR